MRVRNKILTKIVLALMVVVLTANPMVAKADALTNSQTLLDLALDTENHPIIFNYRGEEETSRKIQDRFLFVAEASFQMWALYNLKNPSSAKVVDVLMSDISFALAYDDMNEAYIGLINDIMIDGYVTPEKLQTVKFAIEITYTATNSYGATVQDKVYGVLYNDLTFEFYKLGEHPVSNMAFFNLFYSGRTIMH